MERDSRFWRGIAILVGINWSILAVLFVFDGAWQHSVAYVYAGTSAITSGWVGVRLSPWRRTEIERILEGR